MRPGEDIFAAGPHGALDRLRTLRREARLRAYLSSPERLSAWKRLEAALNDVERVAERTPNASLAEICTAVACVLEFLE